VNFKFIFLSAHIVISFFYALLKIYFCHLILAHFEQQQNITISFLSVL